jgi:fibronectin type 3 domain-containing protein
VTPSTSVTAYHQASPTPSSPSTIGAGVNSNETVLTPTNVNSTTFGKLFATTVDGQVYAQPLYMENVNITTGANQGTHNVVFVATEHDSLYAIDSTTGTILWQVALLTAEHGGSVTSVPNSAVNSSDISPEIGVTATPVIDPTTNTIFVEAKTQEVASNGTHFEHHLYAINIQSGAVNSDVLIADSIGDTYVSGPSVTGTGAGAVNGVVHFDALRQMDRPALTLVNGNIYLAFASHGDNGPYHGWILGYSESSLTATAVFNVNPNGTEDGIWQAGGTLAYETVNGNTFLYFETGNGTFDTTLTQSPFNSNLMIPNKGDYGDSFVKVEIDGTTAASGGLDATNNINGWGMHVVDYFTPMNEGNLSNGDTDLGSGAPLLLPASAGSATHPNLMVGAGKEGRIYLIDRNNMGGYGGDAAGDGASGTDRVVQETTTGAVNGSLGTPTFFNGALYYVGGYGDQARTFSLANGVLSSSSVTHSTDSYPFPGSTPTISTDTSGGNAIVWDIAGPGTNQLRAYSASAGYGTEIYTSAQAANSRDALGSAVKFTVPTVADGEVFVGTTNSLVAYGLLQQATAAPAAPSNLTASAFSGSVINLSWTDHDTSPNTATAYNIFESTNGGAFTQVGTASAGATSFAVGGLQVSTQYSFEIDASNSMGTSAFSNIATATTTSQASALDFSSGFANSSGVLTYNGSAKINGTSAQLTDGGGSEAGSVFSTNKVDVTQFGTQFSFQLTAGSSTADGFTFTIQGVGPTALGPSGGGLGYGPDHTGGTGGIASSVAVKFDLYNNQGEGTDSTGLYIDGVAPTNVGSIDLTGTGIDLHSGDVINVTMTYDGTTLTVTETDPTVNKSASQSYTINIPNTVGGGTAYVGFTAGTGGLTATQDILSWSYTPTANALPAAPSNLTGTVISGSEVDISWTNNANNQAGFLVDRSTDGVTFNQIASVGASVTTYHDTSLSPGETVYYEVRATNAAGDSAFSNVFKATTAIPPAPPTNVQATKITTTEVDLSWTNVATNATGIKILAQLGNNTARVVATGLAPTTTSFNVTGLTPGSPYLFEIDALNSSGPSGAATFNASTLTAAPTNLTAAAGNGVVNLSWTAPTGAVSYDVYRGTTAGGESAAPLATGVTAASFSDTTVTNGATYFYTVTAVNANAAPLANQSAASNEASATPQVATPPAAPTNLKATPVAPNQGVSSVTLAWTASAGATSSDVYRSTTANGEGGTPLATGVTGASYTDKTAVFGTTYFYKVSAVNGGGQSGLSNEVSATPLFTAHIHFTAQSGGDTVANYLSDVGLAYGSRVNGLTFGWNQDNTANGRDRDASNSPDELHDGLTHLQKPNNPNAWWGIAVPNGTYTVHLIVGDPSYIDSVYKENIGGTLSNGAITGGILAVSGTPTASTHWFTSTVTVTVTGGVLYLSNATGSSNDKIDAIDVTQDVGSGGAYAGGLDYAGGFAGQTGLTLNGSANLNGSRLELTDGHTYEAASVFSTKAVNVGQFSTQFSFQLTNPNADGLTFTIQGVGPTALGSNGGGLGYGTDGSRTGPLIKKSLAVKFDLYNNQGEGVDSTGVFVNGASPTNIGSVDLSKTGIDLHSGHVFNVSLSYDGSRLSETIVDATTGASFSKTYTVNLKSLLGTGTAWVGFTGATGGATATEDVLSWSFNSLS